VTLHLWGRILQKYPELKGRDVADVGHHVKTQKNTPAGGNERGDIEIKDYIVFPRGEEATKKLSPRTLISNFHVVRALHYEFIAHSEVRFARWEP